MRVVVDNAEKSRYEMVVEDRTAFVVYRRSNDTVALLHAEVPPELEGRGVGSELVHATLEAIRKEGRKVIPRCSFVAAYMRRHPEVADLLAR